MGITYLFDTNVIIYFLGKIVLGNDSLKHLDSICKEGQHISIITKLELLGYRFENVTNEYATKKFVSFSKIHQITPEIERETIALRKSTKIKLPDAIIAATAIVNGFTLISANVNDFKGIKHLNLADPLKFS